MNLSDLLHEAFRALEANRGRSLLTILGIVIGIGSVIAMTSLIGGIQTGLVNSMGLNAARMESIAATDMFTHKDLEKIKRAVPALEAIEGTTESYETYKSGDRSYSVGITGCTPEFLSINGYDKVSSGSVFTSSQNTNAERVCILDTTGVKAIFGSPDTDVINKSVTLGSNSYRVIGVREAPLSSADYFNVFMPEQTVIKDFGDGTDYVSTVVGLAKEGSDMDQVVQDTISVINQMKGYTGNEDSGEAYVYSMKSDIDALNSFMQSFQLIMGSVAGISLLVGGIGIMNMMLTNVTERIREIGIRRALGATSHDITAQFLMESALLCVTGGIIGVIMGFAGSWGLVLAAGSDGIMTALGGDSTTTIAPDISVTTVALAVGISIAIGIIFGYYPARRAAKLDPVECLRYQ